MATAYQQTWESVLLPLAYEAEHQAVAPTIIPVSDGGLLDRAYAYCDSITPHTAEPSTWRLACCQPINGARCGRSMRFAG